jgi:methionyl-tRNA synthetase
VAVFGNFINRTFVLMHKLCKGKVPPFHSKNIDDKDSQLLQEITATKSNIESLIETYKFRDALYEVIDLARKGNRYMQEKEPWIVARNLDASGNVSKEAQESIDNCLHICLQLSANLAIFINPFLPFAARKMMHMMKVVEKMLDWENAGKTNLLSVGYSLRAPELLFRKIDDTEVAAQLEKLINKRESSKKMSENPNAPVETAVAEPVKEAVIKPAIQFDDFAKIDLKVGTIISASKVEKADKLLKLEIDLGSEIRTIVSGIALHFTPEEIVGKSVTVVANLAPRKMRGIEINGMILMAENSDGKLVFINADTPVANGSGVS